MTHFCLCGLSESSYLQSLNCLQYFQSVLVLLPLIWLFRALSAPGIQ